MYIYFDVNGNLKEVIQEPVREGSINHNKIYVYVESGNPEPIGGVYHLPVAYTHAKANFKLLDTDTSLNPSGNSVQFTKVNNVEIPLNQKRDLYFFKYGYKYEMWYMELPETVTEVDGVVSMTAYLYNMSNQLPLNTYNFNVESSVGVVLDSTMTQAQYSYLYNLLHNYSGSRYNSQTDPSNYIYISYYGINFYEDNEPVADLLWPSDIWQNDVLATERYVNDNAKSKKATIGTFNTNEFELDADNGTKVCQVDLSDRFIEGSDLLIITWGGCFAICPVPASGPGRVVAALWNANGEAQTTRIRYELKLLNSVLEITLPSSFQLPSNFTGYVINYKIM